MAEFEIGDEVLASLTGFEARRATVIGTPDESGFGLYYTVSISFPVRENQLRRLQPADAPRG